MAKRIYNDEAVQMSFDGMVDGGTPGKPVDAEQEEESSAPLAIYSDQPEFHPEDITPPVVKLLQALSPEVVEGSARAGNWSLPGFEPKSEIMIVPISFARRREYRPEDSPTLSCASYDGETGDGEPGGVCADCPMNKWTGEGRNRKGPQCVFMYSYMVYVAEYDTIGVINFKRTGLAVGRSLNSVVARMGIRKVAVKLAAKLQQGSKGSYYIPQLLPLSPTDSDRLVQKAGEFMGKF